MGSAERAIGLTKYFLSLPRARNVGAYLVLAGMVFGVLIATVNSGELGIGIFFEGAGAGIFLITVPAFLSAFTVYLLRRDIPMRRVLFLSLIGSVIYGIFYISGILLSKTPSPVGNEIVFVGFGLIFVVWFLIARLVFGFGKTAFVFSLLQVFYNAFFLLASKQIALGGDFMSVIVKMYFASFLFLIGFYALFFVLNAPMKRNIGIKSTDAISMFAAQWLDKDRGLEETFLDMGEEVETLLGTVVFRGKGKETVFLAPYVHFGPFGNLGGSEFPKLLAQRLEKKKGGEALGGSSKPQVLEMPDRRSEQSPLGREVFVFHSLVTNDFNPVAASEIEKIIGCFEGQYRGMEFSPAKGGICTGKCGDSKALCLRVNDCAFVGFSRAPLTTEDVNFGIGRSLMNMAKNYVKEAVLVDEHNSETGDITSVEPGSPIQFEMEGALEDALLGKGGRRAQDWRLGAQDRIMLGTGSRKLRVQSLGGGGIKVALFGFGKTDNSFAFIVLDSNGVTPKFRQGLLDEVKEWGKQNGFARLSAEIFTTDTHEVNLVRGVLNPSGKGAESEKIISAALECLSEAKESLEEVKAGFAVDRFKASVFGAKQSTEVVATISAIIAIARIAVPVILIGTVVAVLWGIAQIK